MTDVETKKIVRLLATDIDGELKVERALRKIKGIGFAFSRAVCIATGIDSNRKIGSLSAEEIKKIENFIKKPNLPSWLLNRRKDMETGEDRHLTKSELDMKIREDINLMKKIRSYKGIRHELGLPVRGQRTRSSFRTQKTVGVMKKKSQPAKSEKK
ncbi:MAG: 30S ribosomal protein S13 [Candidatus Aenigmatarchaeota archaeon]